MGFGDKTLEDAFNLEHHNTVISLGATFYASFSIFTVIILGLFPTERSDLFLISHLGFTLIAFILLRTRQDFMMIHIQVKRERYLFMLFNKCIYQALSVDVSP
jgi:hypothetical protein